MQARHSHVIKDIKESLTILGSHSSKAGHSLRDGQNTQTNFNPLLKKLFSPLTSPPTPPYYFFTILAGCDEYPVSGILSVLFSARYSVSEYFK